MMRLSLKREHLPGAPVLFTLFALVVMVVPQLRPLFIFERFALQTGEYWRLVSSQWVHFDVGHMTWDVLLFFVLGLLLWRRSPTLFLHTTILGSILLPIWVLFGRPDIEVFCGLSGIDSALFGGLVLSLLLERERAGKWFLVIVLVGFLAKLIFEVHTNSAFFVDGDGSKFVPMPDLHLLGFLLGACLSWIHRRN